MLKQTKLIKLSVPAINALHASDLARKAQNKIKP